MRIRARPNTAGDARAAVVALALALGTFGCANPYCGASGEPCCGNECAPGLACAAGVCTTCGVELGPCCAGAVACETGLACTTGLVDNRCARRCDVFANDCPGSLTCVWIILDPGGVCSPGAISPVGLDRPCENVNDCEPGLVCVAHPPDHTVFFCELPCHSQAECGASHTCLPISTLPGETRMSCY